MTYFSEKLENLYSNHSTLKILRKNKRNSINSGRKSIDISENFKLNSVAEKLYSGFELNNLDLETDEEKSRKTCEKRPKANSLAQKKLERQTKAKIIFEFENEKDKEIVETSKLMVNFIEKSNKNDDVVKNDLKKQMSLIKEKINIKKSIFFCFFFNFFKKI